MLSSQLLHDTKSIFCHQVQFFIFYILGVNSWGDASPLPQHFRHGGHVMLSFQLLHDTKSICCHQVQFVIFSTT